MPRESNADRLQRIHREALEEFDAIQTAQRDERMQALQDRRFCTIAGAQWEGDLGELFSARPRFEFNRVHLAVIRVVNEYRNNRVTVDFVPKDGAEDDFADVCDGLYRADEKTSGAEEAYDNAFEEAAQGGMGAWRLRACLEDDDDEEDEDDRQRVKIEPIHDADSCVFFDLGSKRQDKRDARRCYVLTPMTPAAYRDEYDDDPDTWEKSVQQWEFDWCTPDLVWVCEHYRIEERKEQVRWYVGLDGTEKMKVTQADIDANPQMLDTLAATGFRLEKVREVERHEVHKFIMSGGKVLEDCGVIAGKCIPIVVTYGKRWVVDGIERFMGHVRLAKDAQRLMNSLLSWLADMAGRFDVEKPIFTPEQIRGHATLWAEDNVKRYPFLLINATTDAQTGQATAVGPQAYTKAPQIPPAMAALVQIASQALEDLLGAQERGEEMQPNISGKAVELIQQRLDGQAFIYTSNFAKAMKRSGEIWLSMMKDIAVEERRRMKTIGPNGEPGSVLLNEPAFDAEAEREYRKNDLSRARMEVDVEVGPSSSSKKAATVRAITGMLQMVQDPETANALTLAGIANLDGEGLADIKAWARAKAIRMGAMKPNEQERQELAAEAANAKPDPQALLLQKAAEEAEANAAKARADVVDKMAGADLKRAQTAKTLAETEATGQQQILDAAAALQQVYSPPAGAVGSGSSGAG